MYVPVAAAGYVVYGSAIKSNVTQSLSVGALRYSVEILITVHLVMAFVIVINPLCQELEELMKIPLSKSSLIFTDPFLFIYWASSCY